MEASVPAAVVSDSVFAASVFAVSVFASVPAAGACDAPPEESLEPQPARSVPAMAAHNTEASNLFFMLYPPCYEHLADAFGLLTCNTCFFFLS